MSTRMPDYIYSDGSEFFFKEMYYMCTFLNERFELETNTYGELLKVSSTSHAKLNTEIQQAYQDYLVDSILLGGTVANTSNNQNA